MNSASALEMLLYLNSLGDVVPLSPYFNPKTVLKELQPFEKDWQLYNRHKEGNRRWGLSITSLDGGMSGDPDLYSIKDYNELHGTHYREDDFSKFTPAYDASPELQQALQSFSILGRSHILRMGKGGFFPPHRDNALLQPECFRIFVSLNTIFNHYSFVLNDKQHFFDAGAFYLVNTTLPHSLVSFHDHAHFLVLNVPLNLKNIETVTFLLSQN